MDMDDIINALVNGDATIREVSGKPVVPDRAEADKLLTEYLKEPAAPFKRGDRVRRNVLGAQRYNMPKDNMTAAVARVFDKGMIDDEGVYVDMMIAVAVQKGVVLTFVVDSAYYTLADGPSNVVKIKGL